MNQGLVEVLVHVFVGRCWYVQDILKLFLNHSWTAFLHVYQIFNVREWHALGSVTLHLVNKADAMIHSLLQFLFYFRTVLHFCRY